MLSLCQTDLIPIRADIVLVLILVQTVSKEIVWLPSYMTMLHWLCSFEMTKCRLILGAVVGPKNFNMSASLDA